MQPLQESEGSSGPVIFCSRNKKQKEPILSLTPERVEGKEQAIR